MTVQTKILRHVLVWIIFISYEVAYIHFTVGVRATLSHFAIYYCLNIALFYVNAHLILDYSFFKTDKPYFIALMLVVIEMFVYLLLKFGLDYATADAGRTWLNIYEYNKNFLLANIWRGVYFIGFSTAYWSMLYFLRFKERNHQMETAELKSHARSLELENKYISVENAYLQNQISPHLLFNSLNFIYNRVYKESAEAGKSVSLLAELMRYSLVSTDDSRTAPLDQEVAQIANLVELCRMRFPDQFFLRFRKKGKLMTVQIMPLILVTLVENMMKHGDLGDPSHPALIHIKLEGTRLLFETRNKLRPAPVYRQGSGVGLKNIEKRLVNHYPGKYALLTGSRDDYYTAHLTIEL